MIQVRIVSPPDRTDAVRKVLSCTPSVINLVVLPGVAHRPDGDLILCDVAREDASVILDDLKHLNLREDGSISLVLVDSAIGRLADAAERHARGSAADAVVWEEVEQRTSESVELSGSFVLFLVLAAVIAAIGIFQDSEILVVGAMVVGPEFGPIAGLCVALVQKRGRLAGRSAAALAVGFPLAILAAFVLTAIFKDTALTPDEWVSSQHQLASLISHPDAFAALVALAAGAAGMLSLTTAKSGALIGVLISVTTIPAAANVGIAAAYGDWDGCAGSVQQLALNLACILTAGSTVLAVQRALFRRRLATHVRDELDPPPAGDRTMAA